MGDWLLKNTHIHRRHSAALEGSCRKYEHPNAHPNRRPKALAGSQGENEKGAGTQHTDRHAQGVGWARSK